MKLPEMIVIDSNDKHIQFKVVELDANVYALKHGLHVLRNEDDMTFGYIVYMDNFIYAYVVSPTLHDKPGIDTDQFDFHVVYSSFVGPDTDLLNDSTIMEKVVATIAATYLQYEETVNVRPSMKDKDRFAIAYNALRESIDTLGSDYVTSYITPLLTTATHLKAFYTHMVKDLEDMHDEVSHGDLDGNIEELFDI